MKTFRKLALSVAIASTLTVSGCGGGGGGSSSAPAENTARTITGTAVKGILKNAVVTAWELDDDGDRLEVVGGATTDSNGDYTLDLDDNYTGGLIEIVVTASEKTRMVCDASACFGEEVDLSSIKLSTIIPTAKAGSKIQAPVTAWSTMAAERAKTLARSKNSFTEAVAQARAEVTEVAGFDVANTPARAITDLDGATPEEAQAAVMNAVVAELVFDENGELNTVKLDEFAKALNDGEINEAGFTPKDFASKTRLAYQGVKGLDEDAQLKLLNQIGYFQQSGDSITPSELDSALGDNATQEEKIAAFQKFTDQFRTWVSAINKDITSLEDEDSEVAEALGADIDTLNDVFTQAGVTGDLVARVLNELIQNIIGEENRDELLEALENGKTYTAKNTWVDEDDPDISGSMDATLTFERDGDNLKVTATGEVSADAGEVRHFDLTLTTGLPEDEDLGLDTGNTIALLARETIDVSGSIKDGNNTERASLNLTVAPELSETADNTGVTGDASREEILASVSALALEGTISLSNPDGAGFNGEISATAVAMEGSRFSEMDELFSPDSLTLSGEFIPSEGESFSLSASVNNDNARSFNIITYLNYNNTTNNYYFAPDRKKVEQFIDFSGIDANRSYSFNIYSDGWCWDDQTELYGDWIVNIYGYNPGGDWDFSCYTMDEEGIRNLKTLILGQLNGEVPEHLLTDLSVEDAWIWGSSDYDTADIEAGISFPDLETADDFLKLSFTLTTEIDLEGLPEASAVITLNRNMLTSGSVLANIRWDKGSYNLKVSTEDLDSEEPEVSVAFWNPQGYRLEATWKEDADGKESLTGNAFIDGEDIGDVTLRNGVPVIVYPNPNGDEDIFESLF